MVVPGILAVGMPVAVGVIFRYAFGGDGNEGWLSVAGLLMVGTIGGVLLATYLNNAGGAWDNAKKFIESGGMKDEPATSSARAPTPTRPPSSAIPSATRSRTPPARRCTCS